MSSDTEALYEALEKASVATPRLVVSTLYTSAVVVDAVEMVEVAEVVLLFAATNDDADDDAFEVDVMEAGDEETLVVAVDESPAHSTRAT